MGEIRHRTGSITIEDGQVVVRIAGTRKEQGRSVPWSAEFRVPVAEASFERRAWGQLLVLEGDTPVQLVEGCSRREVDAFEYALADAQDEGRRRPTAKTPVAVTTCAHCGAPGQAVGDPCAYCRVPVSA